MSEWQPIETYKKGTTVIFYYPAEYMNTGKQILLPARMVIENCIWATRKPTHWKSLPKPPIT